MSNYYILQGKKAVQENDIMMWAKWFETANRLVKKTEVANGVEVSTVFLGMDHQFGSGDPLLFETMIFGGERDGYQNRYSTWDEAAKAHEAIVKEFTHRRPVLAASMAEIKHLTYGTLEQLLRLDPASDDKIARQHATALDRIGDILTDIQNQTIERAREAMEAQPADSAPAAPTSYVEVTCPRCSQYFAAPAPSPDWDETQIANAGANGLARALLEDDGTGEMSPGLCAEVLALVRRLRAQVADPAQAHAVEMENLLCKYHDFNMMHNDQESELWELSNTLLTMLYAERQAQKAATS